jgi:aminobenzoyl-glutamate utilization protein B
MVVSMVVMAGPVIAQSSRLDALKQEAMREVAARAEFTQQVVDQIFSYAELGFQEFETSRYLVRILRENGFRVEETVSGWRKVLLGSPRPGSLLGAPGGR